MVPQVFVIKNVLDKKKNIFYYNQSANVYQAGQNPNYAPEL